MYTRRPPVVLIHGLWMTPHSWRGWIDRYRAAGHTVYAPAWPGLAGLEEELDHSKAPDDVGFTEVVGQFDAFVRALPDPPVLVGHSFGGLIVQMLLDRGLGRAGVALHPAPPRGVLLPPSVWRSTWPVFRRPANRRGAVTLTPGQFHYAFANTVPRRESDGWHTELAIPGPGRPLFEAALANFTPRSHSATAIDFANPDRAPLLLVAGGRDHLVPAAVVYENFNRYRRSRASTDFKLFGTRPHLTAVLDGWADVADYALTWSARHTR